MDAVAPLLGLLVLVALFGVTWLAEVQQRRAIVERILGRLEGTLRTGWLWDEVTGAYGGRAFRLRLATSWGVGRRKNQAEPLVGRRYPISVELDLHHPPEVTLRIRPDDGLAAVERALGLVRDVEVAGGGGFDRKFVVEADAPAAVTPLASRDVRGAVEDLLRKWPLDEVALRDGKLIVRGRPDTLGQRELGGLLDALEVLAHAYDRRLGDDLGLRGLFVWVGGRDPAARCPYCRDAISGGPALVTCERCRTVLHAECHEENHGCPILGCGGRRATWAPSVQKDAPGGDGARVDDEGPLDLPPDPPVRAGA